MRKDVEFKNKCNFEGYKKIQIRRKFYSPDCVFEKENVIIVAESSSTGDRKVHIGELIQFIEYAHSMKNKDFYYFLFLCGENVTSPRAETEKPRLKHYYDSYAVNKSDNIKGIYVVDQDKVVITKLRISDLSMWKIDM